MHILNTIGVFDDNDDDGVNYVMHLRYYGCFMICDVKIIL